MELGSGTRTGLRLLPTAGGKPVDLPLGVELTPLQFTPDGKAVLVQQGRSAVIERVELGAPPRRTVVTKLPIVDATRWVEAAISGDATTIAYSFPRTTSDLYVIEPPGVPASR